MRFVAGAFDAAWRGKQRLKPPVCVLEVRDRAKPDGEPIAWLFVQRARNASVSHVRHFIWSICLRYIA